MRKNKVFKELKKRETDEVCYVVPDYLLYLTGIQMISESGILRRADTYEKAYYCEENSVVADNTEKIKGCTMLLRAADVDFAFYDDCIQKRVTLLIRLQAKSFDEAQEAYRILENDIQSNLHTFGITLHPMDANTRMRSLYELCLSDLPMARKDINSYLSPKWQAWLSEVEMKHVIEGKQSLTIKGSKEVRGIYYMRRVSSEHAAKVYRLVKSMSGIKLLVTCYEPIDDQCVAAKIRKEYFLAEAIFANLIHKNRGIGKILDVKHENERRYMFAGMYFVLAAETEEKLLEVKTKMMAEVSKYHCEMAEFFVGKGMAYQFLHTFRPWHLDKTNLILTQNAVKMNPFYTEDLETEAKRKEENDLLSLFDKMI